MFNRRKFLTGLLALPGLALAKIMPKAESRPMATIPELGSWNGLIDRFMADTRIGGSGSKVRFGPWMIFWTGWKDSQSSIELAAQWVAWPVDANGKGECDRRMCLYAANPGPATTFQRGDVFNIAWHWPQKSSVEYMDLGSREAIEQALEPERRQSLEVLLELCRIGEWTKTHWGGRDDQWNSAYAKLSKRSQFYLDPWRYMKTHHGIDVNEPNVDPDGSRTYAVYEQLFG